MGNKIWVELRKTESQKSGRILGITAAPAENYIYVAGLMALCFSTGMAVTSTTFTQYSWGAIMNKFEEFKILMDKWGEDTEGHSSPPFWERHANYKLLLEFEDVVPFACLYLKKDPLRAWSLLHAAVKPENLPPALPAYYVGRVPIYQEVYIFWALKEGLLFKKYNPERYWIEDKYGNEILEYRE